MVRSARPCVLTRFRHHRDFVLALARLIPPGARLWLSGWLEAVSYGAMMSGYEKD